MRLIRPVFLDTAGFYAMLVQRDPAHAKALSVMKSLLDRQARFCTTDHVIAETLTLLRARGFNHLCQSFNDDLARSAMTEVETTSRERFTQTITFFLKHADKGYSFTDCLSFIVMKERKLTEALTSDTHFAQAGFKALLIDEI